MTTHLDHDETIRDRPDHDDEQATLTIRLHRCGDCGAWWPELLTDTRPPAKVECAECRLVALPERELEIPIQTADAARVADAIDDLADGNPLLCLGALTSALETTTDAATRTPDSEQAATDGGRR